MASSDLKMRTKSFALEAIRLIEGLPSKAAASVIGRQLLRSATSVGANYRAACRARSKADFIAKMGIVEEEADESIYWLELLVDSGIIPEERARGLADEANQLLAITVASINTARRNNQKPKAKK